MIKENVYIEAEGMKDFILSVEDWTHEKGEKIAQELTSADYIEYDPIPYEYPAGVFKCKNPLAASMVKSFINDPVKLTCVYE